MEEVWGCDVNRGVGGSVSVVSHSFYANDNKESKNDWQLLVIPDEKGLSKNLTRRPRQKSTDKGGCFEIVVLQ